MSKNLSSHHWVKDAKCKNSDTKIFISYDINDIELAKSICKTCPVRVQCYHDYDQMQAIAGGFSFFERLQDSWQRIENEKETNWKISYRYA